MGRVETFLSSLREWIAADETTPKIIYASRKPAGKFGLFNTPFPDKTHIAMGTHLNFTIQDSARQRSVILALSSEDQSQGGLSYFARRHAEVIKDRLDELSLIHI